jgi:O-antigen/teichoic acid export membrane protein
MEQPGAGLSSQELQRRAARGSVWTAAHALFTAPVGFLANAVVARLLGPADYGRLAFLTLALMLVMQLTHLAVSSGVTQWGAAAVARGDSAAAEDLLSRSLGFHVLVQMPCAVAAVVVLARDEGALVRGGLVLSVLTAACLSSAVLRLTIESRTAVLAKLEIAQQILVQTAVVVAAAVAGTAASVWSARAAASGALTPLTVLTHVRAARAGLFRMRLPTGWPSGFWRFCAYSWLAGLVASLVFSRSEIFLLSHLADPQAVGLFALAYGVSAQLTAPVDALIGPLAPAVTGLLAVQPERAGFALLRAIRVGAVLAGLVTAGILPLLTVALPWLYGPRYAGAAGLLLVLGAASCLQSLCNPVLVFTQARRRTDLVLRASVIALVVDGGLALALIPVLGAWGATAANVGGFVTYFACLLPRELRHTGITPVEFARASGAWLVALPAAAAAVLPALATRPTALTSVAAVVIGLGSFVCLVRFRRVGLDAADAAAVLDGFHGLPRRVVTLLLLPLTTT